MGFLSCFSPLLPSSRTTSTSSIGDALLDEKSHIEDHAVATRPREDKSARKLAALRAKMEEAGLNAYVVPTADAHGSEWVGECDKRRAWLSGFTGSAGVAVVTLERALMFVDSRYYVQAGKQLGESWDLQKVGEKDVKQWDAWVLGLPEGSKVGIDATLVDYATAKPLLAKFADKKLSLVFPSENLVDAIWTTRPARTACKINLHPLKFSGRPAESKLADLRAYLTSLHDGEKPSAFLLSSLPSIAWLLNLRGSDIEFSPLFFAYLLVPASADEKLVLWVQDHAVDGNLNVEVKRLGGEIKSYGEALQGVKEWTEGEKKGKIVCDGKVSWALVHAAGEGNVSVVAASPVIAAQAVKNEVEIEGFRAAYVRDAAAWIRWLAWLEEMLKKGSKLTEWEAAEELTKYRQSGKHFAGLAYDNISATGENAALPHYAPTATSSSVISLSSPYLNDSGAQYLDGTIDTTRTYHFGRSTAEHKRAFTRVLQGHIAIDTLVFPEGTTGNLIDVLARRNLWAEGMNYGHGTGHGVGSYLSVHEGPQGIAGSAAFAVTPFVPGHVMSNEPGFYEVGSYGIRLESVVVVKEVSTRRGFGDQRWFGFERFTQVPIQTNMVDWKLLSPDEREWLRRHNEGCKNALLDLVKDDKRAVRYLKKNA